MKVSDLPQEILLHIFYYIDDEEEDLIKKGTLLQLQLTCKQWRPAARMVLYRKVDLSSSSQKAALFLRTLQSASGLGQAVRELYFSDDSFSEDISFAAIVKLCPNLRCFYQWEESDKMDLYTPALALHQEGYLQKLDTVSLPSMIYHGSTHFEPYNKLMLATKQTITKLYISEATQFALADRLKEFINSAAPTTPNTQHDNSLQSLVDGLDKFPHITQVKLHLRPLSIQDVQRILYMFPMAVDLSINSRRTASATASNRATVQQEADNLDQLFKNLSIIKRFDVEYITMPFKELLAALGIISKYFLVYTAAIRINDHQPVNQHDLCIFTTGDFPAIYNYGEKPTICCVIEFYVYGSQLGKLRLQDLYRALAHLTPFITLDTPI
ncbi:hypothetical protein MBANPS3_011368 [Mucor bainieri]